MWMWMWMSCHDMLVRMLCVVFLTPPFICFASLCVRWKMTPLFISMLKGHLGAATTVLTCPSVNVNVVDQDGRTILHHTIANKSDSVTSLAACLRQGEKTKTDSICTHMQVEAGHRRMLSCCITSCMRGLPCCRFSSSSHLIMCCIQLNSYFVIIMLKLQLQMLNQNVQYYMN